MPRTTIKVFAFSGKGGPDYSLDSELKQPGGGDPRLRFRGPNWDLDFVIQSNPFGLRFKPVPTDAFWASGNGTCPQAPSQVAALSPHKVSTDGQTLRVKNKNGAIQTFRFSLNFVGEDNDIPRRYDPIIENRNGLDHQGEISFGAIIGAALGGIAALAAIKIALSRAKDRRR